MMLQLVVTFSFLFSVTCQSNDWSKEMQDLLRVKTYEPLAPLKQQVVLGCYSAMKSEFETSAFKPLEKHMHTLVAKKDEEMSFDWCWKYCTYGVGDSRRNKNDFLGITADNKMCACFSRLAEYHKRVSDNSCSQECTGTLGERCRDNTMMVYVVCPVGNFGPPYCEAGCPTGACVGNAFPGTQFENYHLPACRHNGDCFTRCVGSESQTCQQLSERCGTFSGGYPHNYGPNPDYTGELMKKDDITSNETTFVFHNRVMPKEGSPFIDKLLVTHRAVGSGAFFTAHRDYQSTGDAEHYTVTAIADIKDIGYPRTDIFYFHKHMVMNQHGDTLERWTVDDDNPQANDVIGLKVYGNSTDKYFYLRRVESSIEGYPKYAYSYSKEVLHQGDCINAISDSEESTSLADMTAGGNSMALRASIWGSLKRECGSNCFQQRCACEGYCLYSCAPGKFGSTCTNSCPVGYFGLGCRQRCNPGCVDNVCDSVTGECTAGCADDKYHGKYCTDFCPDGQYGLNCNHYCSAHCLQPTLCDTKTGDCIGGCQSGYQPPLCDKPCDGGTYGPGCRKPCGNCKGGKPCDPFSGHCEDGCQDKFTGITCHCEQGFWGPPECEETCGICNDGYYCDGENGVCVKGKGEEKEEQEATVTTLLHNKQRKAALELSKCDIKFDDREPCAATDENSCKDLHCCYEKDTAKYNVTTCFKQKDAVEDLGVFNKYPGEHWIRGGDEREYLISLVSRTYQGAKSYCANLGAEMAKVDSYDKFKMLLSNAFYTKCDSDHIVSVWIGLYNDEDPCGTNCRDKWQWQDESLVQEELWVDAVTPNEKTNVVKTVPCNDPDVQRRYKWTAVNKTDYTEGLHTGVICERSESLESNGYSFKKGVPEAGFQNLPSFGDNETSEADFVALIEKNRPPFPSSEEELSATTTTTTTTTTVAPPPASLTDNKTMVDNETGEVFQVCKCEDPDDCPCIDELLNDVGDPNVKKIIKSWLVAGGKDDFRDALDSLSPNVSQCKDAAKQSPVCKCSQGMHGLNCDKGCGNCYGIQCLITDGDCLFGCMPGYVEPYCVDSCPARFWGQDCHRICGNCSNGMTCDPVTGECSTGCEGNFLAPMCTKCRPNYYGKDCDKECGSCKNEDDCNSETGFCDNGCIFEYAAPFCKCPVGYYGKDCKSRCGFCLNGLGCDPHTGVCLWSCDAGYQGDYCNKTCDGGTFGLGCGFGCNNCHNNSDCNPVDGSCPGGCAGNFRTPLCKCKRDEFGLSCEKCGNCADNQPCDVESGECDKCQSPYKMPDCKCKTNEWGPGCENACMNCKNGDDCDRFTGACPNGCTRGWTGDRCDEKCPEGTYGRGCKGTCGYCLKCAVCSHTNGVCPGRKCQPGYKNARCNKACTDNTWGINCRELCGDCKDDEQCRISDGKCLRGCKPGRVPPTCSDVCPNGNWGPNCAEKCGHCAEPTCDPVEGYCQNCLEGFKPPFCNDKLPADYDEDDMYASYSDYSDYGAAAKKCPKGFYGKDCSRPCGHCLKDICDTETGLCLEGCLPGYRPLYCLLPCRDGYWGHSCSQQCGHCFDKNEVCRKSDGLCVSGCQKGYMGTKCVYDDSEQYEALMLRDGVSAATRLNIVAGLGLCLILWSVLFITC